MTFTLKQNLKTLLNNNNYSNKVLLCDKPLDMTSFAVVHIIKKITKVKKAGHAGTLDPKATGLLIICTDSATKRINSFMNDEKEYTGTFRIGAVTKSFDTESEEENICDNANSISEQMLHKAAEKLSGEVMQTPPIYSALKRNGKPLYSFARKGETVSVEPRKILISHFSVNRVSETEIRFKVICSKGTYIRTLANDFGIEIGIGAYLKTLRRTRIGNYLLDDLSEEINGIKYKILDIF